MIRTHAFIAQHVNVAFWHHKAITFSKCIITTCSQLMLEFIHYFSQIALWQIANNIRVGQYEALRQAFFAHKEARQGPLSRVVRRVSSFRVILG